MDKRAAVRVPVRVHAQCRAHGLVIDGLVEDVSRSGLFLRAAKQIAMSIDVDPALDDLRLDPSRLKQVVYNYVSNALKFTPNGGRVTIRARAIEGDRFRLEVEDTGIGVADSDLPMLFVQFQQLESGKAKRHQGTGLGLALTKRLVEAHGGTVGVTSTMGKGSTFHAVFPRKIEAA